MFRKNREENYDEYNDKYSSKYDDDYIAPSEEYRSECDHDHEQTYSNINTVAECKHSHEQTYDDADAEQRPYDHSHEQTNNNADAEQRPYVNYVELNNFFGRILEKGEKLIWAGSRHNVKPPTDNILDKNESKGKELIFTGLILFIFGMCVIPLVILGVVLMILGATKLSKNDATISLYALTDRRVIIACNLGVSSVPLNSIIKVEHSADSVYITSDSFYHNGQHIKAGAHKSSLLEINDPARVEKLIQDAMNGIYG